MNLSHIARIAVCSVLLSAAASAQLANKVLIVYNSAQPDSLEVANAYKDARGIPAANLCAINSANTIDVTGTANYQSIIRDPIRACLNTAGANSILYIVFSYLTPYRYIPQVPGTSIFAIDSYVADIWDKYSTQMFIGSPTANHGYYADAQAKGNYFLPFVSLANYRVTPKASQIYSVFRLDGPTKDIAKNLVTRAMQAETAGGVSGRACFDAVIDTWSPGSNILTDWTYFTTDWDIRRASDAATKLGLPQTKENTGQEFGEGAVPPCTQTPDQTSFYAGWYTFGVYRDAFVWAPGSVGWHLESAGAGEVRSGQWWVPQALSRGISVTSGAVDEPYLEGIPRPGGVYRDLLVGANVGDAFLRNMRYLKWRMLNIGDPLYRPYPNAPLSGLTNEDSLMLSPRFVVTGKTTKATVTLASAAPPSGLTVPLNCYAYCSSVTFPSSVNVPGGTKTASFTITTDAGTQHELGIIVGANISGNNVLNSFQLVSLIGRIVFEKNPIQGGQQQQAAVVLNGPAPNGGVTVTLQSNNGAATVPATVFIGAGLSVGFFNINTAPVGASTPVTITATLLGVPVTNVLNVNP